MARSISKKVRFDVFKRDAFTCQYCGARPPDVVLEIEHIVPVAGGGEDNFDNLITACFSCNRGKAGVSLTSIPQALDAKAQMIAERKAQVEAMAAAIQASHDRIEDEVWKIAEILYPGSSRGYSRNRYSGVRRFVEKIGYAETLDAALIATSRFSPASGSCFRYFCGICWRKVGEKD